MRSHTSYPGRHGSPAQTGQTVSEALPTPPSDEEYNSIVAQYQQNHSRLMELINEEFGTTAIKW